jgi:hypothetical protein
MPHLTFSVATLHPQEKYHVCWYKMGCFTVPLGLLYGNLEALDKWRKQCLQVWHDRDLVTTRDYTGDPMTLLDHITMGIVTIVFVERYEEAKSLLDSLGLTWSKEGLDAIDSFMTSVKAFFPVFKDDCEAFMIRLMIFLAARKGEIDDAEVNAWIPSPAALAEKNNNVAIYGCHDTATFGARAYLKLGRDDDAYEVSRLVVAPGDQRAKKKTTLVGCYCTLGQVAAKRGDLDEAEGHFANALEEAKLCRHPFMELMAARDWKKYLLAPNGRNVGSAEAAIDAACEKMSKTRAQMALALE